MNAYTHFAVICSPSGLCHVVYSTAIHAPRTRSTPKQKENSRHKYVSTSVTPLLPDSNCHCFGHRRRRRANGVIFTVLLPLTTKLWTKFSLLPSNYCFCSSSCIAVQRPESRDCLIIYTVSCSGSLSGLKDFI